MFEAKEYDTNFLALRDLNWTGIIVLCPPGEFFGSELIELNEGFRHGAIWALLDSETSRILGAGADHGDCNYPAPGSSERLCLITSDPMHLGPRLLDALAVAWIDEEIEGDFSETDIAMAREFQSWIRAADLGSHAIAPSPDLG